ncbi:MAG: transporter [Clostridia bacterium]
MIEKKKNSFKNFILLEVSFFIYAISSLFSKFATYNNENIYRTIIFFSISLIFLGIYAILWQQILKVTTLSKAFSNKGITMVWGLLFGFMIFNEKITVGRILGIIIILVGIVILMYKKGAEND